ncbi:MAG: hypothetical protein L6R41_007319, partial [Letrouitia leprolyta]
MTAAVGMPTPRPICALRLRPPLLLLPLSLLFVFEEGDDVESGDEEPDEDDPEEEPEDEPAVGTAALLEGFMVFDPDPEGEVSVAM